MYAILSPGIILTVRSRDVGKNLFLQYPTLILLPPFSTFPAAWLISHFKFIPAPVQMLLSRQFRRIRREPWHRSGLPTSAILHFFSPRGILQFCLRLEINAIGIIYFILNWKIVENGFDLLILPARKRLSVQSFLAYEICNMFGLKELHDRKDHKLLIPGKWYCSIYLREKKRIEICNFHASASLLLSP